MKILTYDNLKMQVPSAFSSQASGKVSDKYALIPTIDCIRGLEKEGFYPVKAEQSRCRLADNLPYSKHVIRFRKEGTVEVGGNIPEIVLTNSHNGLCSYNLRAGIFRLVCSNGLIVGNELFFRAVRHKGDCIEKVVNSANELIDLVPKALDIADAWKGIVINVEAQRMYAKEASAIRWDEEAREIDYERLLIPRRWDDQKPTLWNTFNTVQEKMINGGVTYKKDKQNKLTRAISSVHEKNRINVALWNLTEKMSNLLK